MGENHNMSSDKQKEHLSALESINASFTSMKEEAAKEKKSLESYKPRVESSGTVDRINASFAEAQKDAAKSSRRNERESQVNFVWNVITGILVTALIVSTVVFLVMIYKGHDQNRENEDNSPAVQMSDTDTESQTADSGMMTESQTAESGTETEMSSEEDTGGETAQTEQADTPREIPEEYDSILTDNEKEEWKNRAADSSRLFVQMNQKLNVAGNKKVYLRLINPPYSTFDMQVKIYTQDDPETVLYQSGILKPGEILEYAEFENIPEPGDYAAGVEYTVYDENGNKIGTHEIAVDITVQEQSGAAGE